MAKPFTCMHMRRFAKAARACKMWSRRAMATLFGSFPGPAGKIDETRSGRIIKDGRLILPENDASVRERRKLAQVGVVMLALGGGWGGRPGG
jgi:mRNA degradation ribonuclease J1/J2